MCLRQSLALLEINCSDFHDVMKFHREELFPQEPPRYGDGDIRANWRPKFSAIVTFWTTV
jgi:hypothetical protein